MNFNSYMPLPSHVSNATAKAPLVQNLTNLANTTSVPKTPGSLPGMGMLNAPGNAMPFQPGSQAMYQPPQPPQANPMTVGSPAAPQAPTTGWDAQVSQPNMFQRLVQAIKSNRGDDHTPDERMSSVFNAIKGPGNQAQADSHPVMDFMRRMMPQGQQAPQAPVNPNAPGFAGAAKLWGGNIHPQGQQAFNPFANR